MEGFRKMIKWHLEQRKISELRNWEKNPRTISKKAFKELEKSVDALGNFEPLVINIDGTVIAGNQRLRLEMKKGNNEVDVYVPERELSEEEIKKIGVISNRHSGDWDMDILANEFDDVLKDLGFDDLLPELVMEVSEDDYEEPEQLPSKVQLGEVWQLGKHRLMCGDSTKIEDVEKLMNGEKADMVFTDPPYNFEGEGAGFLKSSTANMRDRVKDIIDFNPKDIGFIKELDVHTFLVFCNKALVPQYFEMFEGFNFDILVWHKTNPTPFTSNGFLPDIEYLLMFTRKGRTWNNSLQPTSVYSKVYSSAKLEGREGAGDVHPTMKPLSLLSDKIRVCSKQNGIVLDLFGGSGSTLIACEQTGRICYMMELDTHYSSVIIDRWETLTGKKAVKI